LRPPRALRLGLSVHQDVEVRPLQEQTESVDFLLDAYRAGKLSRREFVRRGLALGLTMSAVTGLLAEAASAATRVVEQARAKPGGTLREGYDLDFTRMDPINTNWYDPGFYALYQSIVNKDPRGRIVADIATSWKFAPNRMSLTFKLRRGLRFHTGRPLTAKAIKEVYDTIANPKSGSPLRSLQEPVAQTLAPNDTTLILRFKHPYYNALNVVQTGYWAIVNTQTRNKVGPTKYGQKVIDGSGPFTFVEWLPGSHVTVKRWEDYPGSIVPYFRNKGKAYLDGIRWEAILEAGQRATRIQRGEIDTLRGPNFPDVARLKKDTNVVVTELKEWSGYLFGPNFKRTDLGFDDLRVRRAMSYAIDRKAIADKLFLGLALPLYGPITSADANYTKAVEKYNRYNPDQAKALLDQAGWKEGSGGIREKNGKKMAFTLTIQAETFNQQLGAVLQAQLKEIGMDVKVESLDRGTYFNKLFSYNLDSWMFFYLWPVPIDVVSLFVNSANGAGSGGPNWNNSKIPSVDAALDRWLRAGNAQQLRAGSQGLQVEIAKQLPIIPIVNRLAFWVHRKNVHGYLVHQWNLYPYYNDVWLS
jgi:peptide/nickel transport system substrate-binding protein